MFSLLANATGDSNMIDHIVETAEQRHRVINTASHSMRDIKLGLYNSRKPKLVVFGSSRSMQFRDYFFKPISMTMAGAAKGGAISYPIDIRAVWSDVKEMAQPEVLIIQLDYWRYVSTNGAGGVTHAEIDPPVIGYRDLWWNTNKDYPILAYLMRDPGYFNTFYRTARDKTYRMLGGLNLTGAYAIRLRKGFLYDGSSLDLRYQNVNTRFTVRGGALSTAGLPFRANQMVDLGLVQLLVKVVEEIKSSGTEVYIVLPPMAPVVMNILRKKDFNYIRDVENSLTNALDGIAPVYVFHDPDKIGSSACEFFDETHGGEVAYARMLLSIAQENPDGLGRHLDVDKLEDAVSKWTNETVTPSAFPNLVSFRDLISMRQRCH